MFEKRTLQEMEILGVNVFLIASLAFVMNPWNVIENNKEHMNIAIIFCDSRPYLKENKTTTGYLEKRRKCRSDDSPIFQKSQR